MTGSGRSATDPPPISNLPVQATPFVGRDEEIAAIQDLFEEHRAVLLHDPAGRPHGYGKSEAAITYGHRYRMRYRVAWWFDCSHESDPVLLRQLIDRATQELHTRYREVLRTGVPESPDDKWLLLYDNVADPDRIQEHFPSGEARILVTARPPGTAWDSKAARLPVGDLGASEVASLFRQLAEIRQPVAEELARTFAGHPRQIIAVAEQIRRGTPPAACVALADAVRLAPAPARPAPQPAGHVRMSGQDRETLIDTLLSSPVCRDLRSYREWIEAIDRRTTVSSVLPPETETIRTRVVGLVSIALSRDRPDVLQALAAALAEKADGHEARLVQALIGPAAANWDEHGTPRRAVLSPSPADAPFFFTSYANREDDQDHVAEFHQRLEQELRIKRGRNLTSTGFLDRRSLRLGLTWREPMVDAIRTTRLLVALITADYFESEWCRREWAVMMERARRAGRSPGQEPVAVLPLFWVKPRGPLPRDLAAIQYSSAELFGGNKAPDNLIDLLREDDQEAAAFIRRLAAVMIEAADRDLPALDAEAVRSIPLAFSEWDTGDTSLAGAGADAGQGGPRPHPPERQRPRPAKSEPSTPVPEQPVQEPPVQEPLVQKQPVQNPPVQNPPAQNPPVHDPPSNNKALLIEALAASPVLRDPTQYTRWVEAVLSEVDRERHPAVTHLVDPLKFRVRLLVNFANEHSTPDLFLAMAEALTLVDPGGADAPDGTVAEVHALVDRIVAAWPHHP
ncbi:TIR domain-containing protein [Streptomyces antnestii]|uniref:TIR domain-containing protein n=1 Tax=Streptomyces antnestii TaxID=2494256 RepID=A0A3S3UFB9_9ACTN|nr:toll/interleukin-1 receptor domain-containing protein [Streptomyces sp. San01]RVU22927.1 TIR domain-containing protein [Streptomyces sp. San01]